MEEVVFNQLYICKPNIEAILAPHQPPINKLIYCNHKICMPAQWIYIVEVWLTSMKIWQTRFSSSYQETQKSIAPETDTIAGTLISPGWRVWLAVAAFHNGRELQWRLGWTQSVAA